MTIFPKTDAEALAEARKVIEDARKALDEGRIGDVRRILKTGMANPLKAVTAVIARDGAA